MEQEVQNNPIDQKPENEKIYHHHHHHHHRNPSDKKSGVVKIYRAILLVSGFALIFFSITTGELLLALSGSILLLVSLAFTDVYKRITRASGELLGSLNNTIEENKKRSHRRHHRSH